MPFKRVVQHSDRGSIKDLVGREKIKPGEVEAPLSAQELRIKKLYDYAQYNRDNNLVAALGFITNEHVGNKSALPTNVYRLRQMVQDIETKSGGKIASLAKEISDCFFGNEEHCLAVSKSEHRQRESLIKVASADHYPFNKRSFWRVSNK
jgi:hypothetical protein